MAEKILQKKRVEFIKNPLWEEIKGVKQLKKKSSNIIFYLHQVILTKEIELILRLILQVQNCLKDLLKIYFLLPRKIKSSLLDITLESQKINI